MKKFVFFALATLLACSCGILASTGSSSSSNASSSSSGAIGIRVARGVNTESVTITKLPTSVSDLSGVDITDPYVTSALVVAALMQYESNHAACMEMLEYLNGPNTLSGYEKQFLGERLRGKFYKVRSFFSGATPANNYTPSKPYIVKVTSNPYSFQSGGYATLYLTSGGSDNPRPIKLRKKESTGEWFYNEITFLADIRTPAADDPWR